VPAHVRLSALEVAVLPIVFFALFFGLLIVGSLVANATGHLPNADQLEAEDRRRWQKIEDSA
jgi:hypothetical protein